MKNMDRYDNQNQRERESESSVEDEDEERVSLLSFCEGKADFFYFQNFGIIYLHLQFQSCFCNKNFVKINFHKVQINIHYITERLKLNYI